MAILAKFFAQRSAYLVASVLLGCVDYLDQRNKSIHGIAIDGSLFHHFLHYKEYLIEGLNKLDPSWCQRLMIIPVENGSLTGLATVI